MTAKGETSRAVLGQVPPAGFVSLTLRLPRMGHVPDPPGDPP